MNITGRGEAASSRVLLVDDDRSLRRLVKSFLTEHGYAIAEADDAKGARRILETQDIDIAVIDVMMPGENGLSLVRSLTERIELGIIVVSALGSETDRIVGLEVGADDYLAKPFSPRELLARMRAVQRRQPAVQKLPGGACYAFLGWTLNPVRRALRDPHNVLISLTEGEFSLLLCMVERPLRVLSREQLLDLAKQGDHDVFDRAIDSQISRLRRKLATRTKEDIIHTVRSEGYMFMPEVSRVYLQD